MQATTNIPCAAKSHKWQQASKNIAVPCENSLSQQPRQGEGGRDAEGMPLFETASRWGAA